MQESPPGADPGESGPPGEPRRPRRRRRMLKIVGGGIAVLLIIAGVGGFVVYRQLNANLKSAPLYAGLSTPSVTQTPYVDPFGRSALNILVIGSDSREDKADCDLGGACDGGIHADVELVVHVSADRTNATAMSIPRDTMTNLPGCRDSATKRSIGDRYGQINATLEYGPGCTVAAVQKLTGLTIDHFVMADFTGVISMSDAVGGAAVCVTGDVYDPRSHLKLSKGTHTVTGEGALQFVRTRHAFGDGSDLGRTESQHLFLSSVIRKLKSTGTLVNPIKVYSVAQAATKALTVDTGLASIAKLVGLAGTLEQVPSERITFVTMPNAPDPSDSNRVVVAPSAQRLFDAMLHDKALSAADATTPDPTSTAASPSPTGASSTSSTATPSPTATTPKQSQKTKDALKDGHASTASDSGACAQVSTMPIIYYKGQFMSPARAYQLSTDIPDSAK